MLMVLEMFPPGSDVLPYGILKMVRLWIRKRRAAVLKDTGNTEGPKTLAGVPLPGHRGEWGQNRTELKGRAGRRFSKMDSIQSKCLSNVPPLTVQTAQVQV